MAGVLLNAIEPVNKAAYIGYWLDESLQDKRDNVAIITGADDTLCPARRYSALRHCKCRVDNQASNASHGATILRWKAV